MATVYRITQTLSGNASTVWTGSSDTERRDVLREQYFQMLTDRPALNDKVSSGTLTTDVFQAFSNGNITDVQHVNMTDNTCTIHYIFKDEAAMTSFNALDRTEYYNMLTNHGWTTSSTVNNFEE